MIQNSAIPGHSDLDETQESNVGGCDEAQSSVVICDEAANSSANDE